MSWIVNRSALRTAALLLACSLGLSACRTAEMNRDVASPPPEEPPNIVLIVADDLGYSELGSYGQEKIRTPHIDRMAREGMRFTQFYAGSAVCAPSRSVLMTGLHTGHTPIRDNREIMPIGQHPIPDETVTIAEVLREAGYATGAFGKWGLGGPDSEGLPTRQGFDEFFGYLCQRRAHFFYPTFLFHNEERYPLEGNVVDEKPRSPGSGWAIERSVYSHDAIADKALEFIEQNHSERFFLYVPFTIPHTSLEVPESSLAEYLDEEGNSIFPETPFPGDHYAPADKPHATYAAMVSHMDRDVGRILSKLEELGLDENTIVMFTSDNGPQESRGGPDPRFFDSRGPFRGFKGDVYEGGIRVPLVVRWPGHVPAGTVTDHLSYFGDLMATAADLANTALPDDLDSITFLPVLLGNEENQPEHDYLYWEYPRGPGYQAVRMGEWKAVRTPIHTGEIELFNLEDDIAEARDVSAQHPEVVERIREIMEEAHTPSSIFSASGR